MENKDQHIDDFLSQRFEDFESVPDASMWQQIEGHIEHFKHPIDLSLHSHLSDLSETPPPEQEAILKLTLSNGLHPIDIALNDQLSKLEVIPDPEVYNEAVDLHGKERRKRRGLFWLFSLVVFAGIITFTSNQLQKDNTSLTIATPEDGFIEKEPVIKDRTTEPSLAENKPESDKASQEKQQMDAAADTIESSSLPTVMANNQSAIDKTQEQEKQKVNKVSENESGQYKPDPEFQKLASSGVTVNWGPSIFRSGFSGPSILPMPMKKRVFVYPGETPEKVLNKPNTSHQRTLRLSPFSFHVQFGYLNESAVAQRQKGYNVHKDALPNFKKANGNSKNGDIFTFNFGYRLSGRFVVKTGFQYSSTTEKSTFDYIDNQIPVKNQDGVIVDYFTSPNASPEVHETVKTTTSSYAIPVQLYARIFESRQVSAWFGLGSDFIFNRNSKGALYSFKDEGMRTFQLVKEKKASPLMSLMLQYHMTPSVAFTGNFQMSYLREVVNFDNAIFVKPQLLPSLRLGILYTPIIKLK